MEQFVKRASLFVGLLLLVLFLLRQSVPFHWAHPIINKKMAYALEHQKDYNAFFIGSSSVYRQVNPAIFDQVTQLKSFNLGFDASFFLEAHFLVDNFLAGLEEKDKTIFLSEVAPHVMMKQNLHTLRNKYYMDGKRLKMAWKHHWRQKNYTQLYYHSLAFLGNQLCIGEISSIISFHFEESIPIKSEIINQQGFYPMDQELELEQKQNLQTNRTNYLQSKKYKQGKNLTKQEIGATQLTINTDLINYQNISTNSPNLYRIPLYLNLGPKYDFDNGHLNKEGATIFSQKLGEAYNRIK